jgi:hypothetical protein
MKIRASVAPFLVGALALAVSDTGFAQSTLGGARQQQNKIGGIAKPAPVVGGAAVHTSLPPNPPRPGPVINLVNKPATMTPGSTGAATLAGQAAGTTAPRAPLVAQGKSSTVASPGLKCASGACVSKGAKP